MSSPVPLIGLDGLEISRVSLLPLADAWWPYLEVRVGEVGGEDEDEDENQLWLKDGLRGVLMGEAGSALSTENRDEVGWSEGGGTGVLPLKRSLLRVVIASGGSGAGGEGKRGE